MDYKKEYLKEKLKALQLEMSLLNSRAEIIMVEIPKVGEELKEYDDEKKEK